MELSPIEKEKKKCFEKWNKSCREILNIIHDKDFHPELSFILENQSLYNERYILGSTKFKRISIPLICHIFNNLEIKNLISIQTCLSNHAFANYFKNNELSHYHTLTRRMKLKSYLNIDSYENYNDITKKTLDACGQEIALEIQGMILEDITSGAAIKNKVYSKNKIISAVDETIRKSEKIYKRPYPNWIITNREMALIISKEVDIKIYLEEDFPNKILIGYRGEHPYDSGYVLSPHVMLVNCSEEKCFLTQIGRSIVDPTYYSTIQLC